MKHVSFEEYEAAKAEIIGGVHYIEKSTMENDVIHKTYSTEENGTFYEVNDKGRVEFWSDKHSESRIYDENERATETDKKAGPGYGDLLAERIRANADASKLTDFEKFVLDRGYMFATETDLKAGYDRKWKANHGIALTLEEFTAEAECRGRKLDTLQEVYRVISEHIKAGRLTAGALMGYAYYAWCLRKPEAIIAYQIGTGKDTPVHQKWAVNNCSQEITEAEARVAVCEEFGFEVIQMAETFSKDRLSPMLRDTPVLRDKVNDKSRNSGNTILQKIFPGGHVTMVGANSPSSLASRPIRILLADEIDRYPATAGNEGDPLLLAGKRLATFWNKKEVCVSTPTNKETSRIAVEFEHSTQEEWNVPCPACGAFTPLLWANIVFDRDKLDEIGCTCPACGVVSSETEWKEQYINGKFVAAHPERKVRGFHLFPNK